MSEQQWPAERRQTHYGLEIVDEEEKAKRVHVIFEAYSTKYNLLIDLTTFGLHRMWKHMFMTRLAPMHGTKLLDMAGGTGDITFKYIEYLKSRGPPPAGQRSAVTVCDVNQAMLDVGKARAEKRGYTSACDVDVTWRCDNGEQLSLPDDTYNVYTISFGIRHVSRIDKVLQEAYRVLAPGGRFLCLDLSHVSSAPLRWAYEQYLSTLPLLGMLAGQRLEAQYLVEGVRRFPDQEKFASMIEEAGFKQVTYENLMFGICAIHSGYKI